MAITRRRFLGIGAVTMASTMVPWKFGMRDAYAFNQSSGIPLFGTTLRGAGPGGIPVALPEKCAAPVTGVTHYTMNIGQFSDPGVCPTLGPTTLWGYNPFDGNSLGDKDKRGNTIQRHLGGIIIGQKGKPIQITFNNQLYVKKHIIPNDLTIPGANQAINRAAVHFHGGLVPWISDGGPFDWFDPYGSHGLSFLNNQVLNPFALPGSAEYYYPMNQSARFGWYHDHAFGITRINAYAGVASGLLIRDSFEANLINKGLPNYVEAGGNEIPLVIQDKIFVGANIATADPLWTSIVAKAATTPGSLWYAHTYEANQADGTGRWDRGSNPGAPPPLALPDPSCIPEFFGDTMLVNGTVYPKATVQARRYRLRLLNACNARFLNLQLYVADGSPDGITLDTNGAPGSGNARFVNGATGQSTFLQIGTEGGFLANPVQVPCCVPFDGSVYNGTNNPSDLVKSLLVAPAERPDLIVDFSGYAGKSIVLYNDAPSPFPGGDDRNDYFPGWNVGSGLFGVGNPVNGTTQPGHGPNTRVLMRFDVVAATGVDAPLAITPSTDLTSGIDPTILPTWGWTDDTALPFPKRFLSLNEDFDEYGRLRQVLGNADAPNGSPYATAGATQESVAAGATEVWEIYNNTGDVHPMHFHLVNVQLINRQVFSSYGVFTAAPTGPASNEIGWKETVMMYPGTVTRVIMKFDMSGTVIVDAKGHPVNTKKSRWQLPITNGMPPVSPRTGGNEYVWHCHILEHEEHDMMHALVVT